MAQEDARLVGRANCALEDPQSFSEALASPQSREWKEAMECELRSLHSNEVWTLTDLPKGKKVIGSRWVFKTKLGADGQVDRYKARLVAKGFAQRKGSDYDETFSPVVRGESVRMILALAAQENLHMHQMDVETAFLHGELQEEVYMQQPDGHESEGHEEQICRLHCSIYGLRQSPRCWNHVLDRHLKGMKFTQTQGDPCVYVSSNIAGRLLVAVYVDDLVIAGDCEEEIKAIKRTLSSRFRMKDLGDLHHFLGIEVVRDLAGGVVWFGQSTYTGRLLDKFGMAGSKPVSTPADPESRLVKRTQEEAADPKLYQAAVGGLLYLSTKTRPDIAFAVGNAARFSSDPSKAHWQAVKRIMRYLQGSLDLGLRYQRQKESVFTCTGYADADWGGSQDDRKSTSGYIFQANGAAISWRSQKQTCVALSTAEAEYISLSAAAQEAIWLRGLSAEIAGGKEKQIEVHEDNQSPICMASNPVYHGRTKHVELKYHYVRTRGHIRLTYCPIADALTRVYRPPSSYR